MKSAIPSDLLKLKKRFEAWRKLAPNDPKLRITFSMSQRLCSIIIPPRWSAASAGSISALSGGAPPQSLLPAARGRQAKTNAKAGAQIFSFLTRAHCRERSINTLDLLTLPPLEAAGFLL